MSAEDLRAVWMFRLLDYEHYMIDDGGESFGQVVVNHADQTVAVIALLEVDRPRLESIPRTYRRAMRWLRVHEFSSRQAE